MLSPIVRFAGEPSIRLSPSRACLPVPPRLSAVHGHCRNHPLTPVQAAPSAAAHARRIPLSAAGARHDGCLAADMRMLGARVFWTRTLWRRTPPPCWTSCGRRAPHGDAEAARLVRRGFARRLGAGLAAGLGRGRSADAQFRTSLPGAASIARSGPWRDRACRIDRDALRSRE